MHKNVHLNAAKADQTDSIPATVFNHCGRKGHTQNQCWTKNPSLMPTKKSKSIMLDIPNKDKGIKDAHNLVKSVMSNKSTKRHMVDRSSVINNIFPFSIDWEGHDQDEVSTGVESESGATV